MQNLRLSRQIEMIILVECAQVEPAFDACQVFSRARVNADFLSFGDKGWHEDRVPTCRAMEDLACAIIRAAEVFFN